MHKINPKLLYLISIGLFIVSIIQLVVSIIKGVIPPEIFYNSDALYLPTIFRGLIEDGYSFRSFRYPDAPFFFPDFLIFIIIQFITNNYFLSNLLTAILIFTLTYTFIFKLVTTEKEDAEDSILNQKTFTLGVLSAFMSYLAQGHNFLFSVFFISPVFHEGQLLIQVVLLFLAYKYFIQKPKLDFLVIAITILITISDRSVLKDFTIPFLATVGFVFIFSLTAYNKLKLFSKNLIIGSVLGLIFFKIFIPYSDAKPFNGATPIGRPMYFWELVNRNVESFGNSLVDIFSKTKLFINVGSYETNFSNHTFAVVILMIIIYILCGIYLIQKLRGSRNNFNNFFFIYSLFLLFQIGATLGASTFGGFYRGLVHLRYFTSAIIFTLIWIVWYVKNLLQTYKPTHMGLVGITLGIIAFIPFPFLISKNTKSYFEFESNTVKCLEGYYEYEEGPIYGLGDLWNGSQTTLLSNGKYVVYPASTSGVVIEPSHWLSSLEWFLQDPSQPQTKTYSFIVNKNLNEDLIKSDFGEAEKYLNCGDYTIGIYPRENSINDSMASKFFFGNLTKPGQKIIIPGSKLNDMVFSPNQLSLETEGTKTDTNTLLLGNEQIGRFAEGPVLTLQQGYYKIKLTYRSNMDEMGKLVVKTVPDNKIAEVPLINTGNQFTKLSGVISIGINDFRLEETQQKAGSVYMNFFKDKEGELEIESLSIERLNESDLN